MEPHAGSETEVLLTWEFEPEVAWRDDQHLVITIQEVSHFRMSLHQAEEITIVYRVADGLSEENFRRHLEAYERRWEVLISEHRGTVTGDNARDLEALKSQIARQWDDYHRFQDWAKANAENGGL